MPSIVDLLTAQNIYSMAIEAALKIFELSNKFSHDGPDGLHTQLLQFSSSICENLSQAWQNRSNEQVFVDKLNDAAIDAGEIQSKIDLALKSGSLEVNVATKLNNTYENILDKIATMMNNPQQFKEK